jgi:hypothetical protein
MVDSAFNCKKEQQIEIQGENKYYNFEKLTVGSRNPRFFYFGKKKERFERVTTRFRRKFKTILPVNRLMLSNILGKKITYQYKFSAYIKYYLKKTFKDTFLLQELTLFNILIRSHLFFGDKDLNFFLKNSFIYINNQVTHNKSQLLRESDKINFVFNKQYFFYYRRTLILLKHSFLKLGAYTALRKTKEYH